MSHILSPGPQQNQQMFVQSASTTPSTRQKTKAYATGIAAGAEDEKYQAKYKELKRKVKEIEMDNDKLHFKVLMAKKSIQRMKLERAVLYERLSAVPPSPDIHSHHALPPMHPGPGVPPQQIPPTHHRDRSRGPNDRHERDPIHGPGSVRVISGPDGRPVQVSDGHIGPGIPPSHTLPLTHRRSSASGHPSAHDSRQLPPLSQLTPIQQHLETHSQRNPHSQAHSPHLHHSNGSSRPHSSSSRPRGHQGPPQAYHPTGVPHPQQYPPESMAPAQQGLHSPPLHERERARRRDSSDPYPHGRQQMSHSSSHSSSLVSPTSTRGSSTHVHNHQRIGPGVNINHPPEFEHERDWPQQQRDFDREATREYNAWLARQASPPPPPPPHPRSRPDREYQDHPPPPSSSSSSAYRLREEHLYTRDPVGPAMYGRSSRSDTPGSGSGSISGNGVAGEMPSRPDNSQHPQYNYDRERQRPYAPRSSANPHQGPNEELDFVHEDGISYSRERERERDRIGGPFVLGDQHRPTLESSRKRSRNDMEVDSVMNDVAAASPVGDNNSGGGTEASSSRYGRPITDSDRGSKRLHQEGTTTTATLQSFGGHDEPEQGHSDTA